MSTTYVAVTGAKAPIPNVNSRSAVVSVPHARYTAVPPAPLPQTLYGSTVQTSYST